MRGGYRIVKPNEEMSPDLKKKAVSDTKTEQVYIVRSQHINGYGRLFGGMPFQLGYCNGHNTKLNCLEYHRCSEFNLGTEDFILLLARQPEIEDGFLDTAKVKAFRVPAGVLVEVYATTLHYAPCHADAEKGFQVLVVLSKGTNTDRPQTDSDCDELTYLTAANKWLLAHEESSEAKGGARVGLKGKNLDLMCD